MAKKKNSLRLRNELNFTLSFGVNKNNNCKLCSKYLRFFTLSCGLSENSHRRQHPYREQ